MNSLNNQILTYNAAMFAAIFGAPAPQLQPQKLKEEKEKGDNNE